MKHFVFKFERTWTEHGFSHIYAESGYDALEIARARLKEDRKIEWDVEQTLLSESVVDFKETK